VDIIKVLRVSKPFSMDKYLKPPGVVWPMHATPQVSFISYGKISSSYTFLIYAMFLRNELTTYIKK
jgi:hypothetical protein